MPRREGQAALPANETSGPSPSANAPAIPTSSDASTTVRTKIQERLHQVVREAPLTKNRSPELIPLMQEYEGMRKKLRALVTSVKQYGEQTRIMNEARAELVQSMAVMACNTPLESDIASELSPAIQQSLSTVSHGTESSKVSISDMLQQSEPKSLLEVQTFGTAHAISNHQEYQKHVVAYAESWEMVVTDAVDSLIKTVRKLQGDRDHYEKKVFGLRRQSNALEVKGKSSPPRVMARLARNEAKLKEAFVKYETEACRMCSLIEAVTHDGWIELQPLCRNYIKWEFNRVGRESDTHAFLAAVLESVKVTSKKSAPKRHAGGKKKTMKSSSTTGMIE